jgi:serine/threonine protein kinase
MGEVYRARDLRLQRNVALKILPDAVARDHDRLARFTREAQTLAALNHPNIAAIYGIEDSGPVHAIAMELVAGEDLSHRIERGALPLDEVLPMTVKVLDFGLAKVAPAASASAAADTTNSPTFTSPQMTAAGVLLGTAPYIAPEIAKGRAADKRADIWAYGVVLFEMLAGRRLFVGDSAMDALAAVVRGEIDWTALPTSTPSSIRQLLERCLETDPRLRLRLAVPIAIAVGVLLGAGALRFTRPPAVPARLVEISTELPDRLLWPRMGPASLTYVADICTSRRSAASSRATSVRRRRRRIRSCSGHRTANGSPTRPKD